MAGEEIIKDQKVHEHDIKTSCCDAEWYRRSRGVFICKECGKDDTLSILLIYNAINE